jgi:hypothetical protein
MNPVAVRDARLLVETKQARLALAMLGWAADSRERIADAFAHGLPNAIRKTDLINSPWEVGNLSKVSRN